MLNLIAYSGGDIVVRTIERLGNQTRLQLIDHLIVHCSHVKNELDAQGIINELLRDKVIELACNGTFILS